MSDPAPWFLITFTYRRVLTDFELAALRQALQWPPWHLLLAGNVAPYHPGVTGGPVRPHGLLLVTIRRPDPEGIETLAQELERNPTLRRLPTRGLSISRLDGVNPFADKP